MNDKLPIHQEMLVEEQDTTQDTDLVTIQDTVQDTIQDNAFILAVVKQLSNGAEQSGQQMMSGLGLVNRIHFRTAYLLPAIEQGLVEMTIPDKPTSRNQKYRLTVLGKLKVGIR